MRVRMADKLLSVVEAGKLLGVTRQRVQVLITEGRLKAEKVGSTFVVHKESVDKFKRLKGGRPKKAIT